MLVEVVLTAVPPHLGRREVFLHRHKTAQKNDGERALVTAAGLRVSKKRPAERSRLKKPIVNSEAMNGATTLIFEKSGIKGEQTQTKELKFHSDDTVSKRMSCCSLLPRGPHLRRGTFRRVSGI